jgi:hypothetical protein
MVIFWFRFRDEHALEGALNLGLNFRHHRGAFFFHAGHVSSHFFELNGGLAVCAFRFAES